MTMNLSGRAAELDAPDSITLGAADATVILTAEGEELIIRDWLMKGEDDARFGLMDRIVETAHERGCTRVRGEFHADGGNEPLREFLAQFGFTMIGSEDESTLWILPVSAYEPMG